MIRKIPYLVGLTLIATACSTSGLHEQPSNRLFPYGVYKHDVGVTFQQEGKDQFHRFFGILELRPETTRMVALSPFGTTVFRLTEDKKTHQISMEFAFEPLRRLEERFRQFYSMVQASSDLPMDWKQNIGALEKVGFEVVSYRKDGIPKEMKLQNSRFSVRIEVMNYEP